MRPATAAAGAAPPAAADGAARQQSEKRHTAIVAEATLVLVQLLYDCAEQKAAYNNMSRQCVQRLVQYACPTQLQICSVLLKNLQCCSFLQSALQVLTARVRGCQVVSLLMERRYTSLNAYSALLLPCLKIHNSSELVHRLPSVVCGATFQTELVDSDRATRYVPSIALQTSVWR
jgi:hypothetical protein